MPGPLSTEPSTAASPAPADPGVATIRDLEEAVRRDPDDGHGWHRLGQQLVALGRYGDALPCLIRAAERQPAHVGCRSELGHLFRNLNFVSEAIHWHGEALALQPDALMLRLNHLFVLPMVAHSEEQIAWCRARCESGLEVLEQEPDLGLDTDSVMIAHPFYLLYQDRDDRALMERYGRLMARCFARDPQALAPPGEPPVASPAEPSPEPAGRTRPVPASRGRLRIGFLSGFFHDHSNARAFEGLIRHLDRRAFEVVLIHLAQTPHDAVRERIEACCEQVVTLPAPLQESAAAVRALELDLLFFTDIGMHPSITMLAAQRLAPVQATGWGVPQTSGLPTIDYYVSGEAVEPPGAEAFYSERLVRLPGLPCCYLSSSIEAVQLPRDYFLLPPDLPLWGCLQRLDKYPPDFDASLEAIARAVPEGLFVFVEEEVPSLTACFLERLERNAPAVRERLVLLGRMARQDFLGLAECLDVLLDPFHFGSGITLYETLHAGTPVVSLEGRFLRSRFVAAAYRLIGVEQPPVARSPEEYVACAVALMQDPQRRSRLRREIATKARQHLYDRMDYVRGFEAFALRAVAEAGAAGPAASAVGPLA
jgi:protein O-GlcNAc transferase